MRVASYFILSLALHAAALAYPVSFSARKHTEIMRVAIHTLEEAPASGDAPTGSGHSQNGNLAAPKAQAKFSRSTRLEAQVKPATDSEPEPMAAKPPTALSESNSALVSAIVNSAETQSAAVSASTGNGGVGLAAGTDEIATSEASGSAGAGSGFAGALGPSRNGPGSDDGQSSSGNGSAVTQARYRDTPRPSYPESARREGREGRVLLRVLVDNQGRSKHVEINSSSGSDVLDRAAAETIRRWRFHPARYGGQPVESWLRIPIEFRLADDAKS
jgi:protein TonB